MEVLVAWGAYGHVLELKPDLVARMDVVFTSGWVHGRMTIGSKEKWIKPRSICGKVIYGATIWNFLHTFQAKHQRSTRMPTAIV
jgi:hypothetical protein